MEKEKTRKISFYVGLVIAIVSIYLAFNGVSNWYHPAVFGIWLVFDFISSRKNKTTFDYILNKDWKTFFNLYLW